MLYKNKIAVFICLTLVCANYKVPVSAVQPDIVITKEDIQNAIPTQADVYFTKKTEKEVKIMEKRHFANTSEFDSPKYRIARLEESSPARIANDSTPEVKDNVGIIDGLMKLYAPDAYNAWSRHQERMYERYNDG